MAKFSYRGRNEIGKLIKGTIEASSSDGVASQLQDRGVIPLAINELVEREAFDFASLFPKKINIEELIMFSRQMHSLNRAGVVLNHAIKGISTSTKNTRLKTILAEMEVSLNSGVNLSTSLRRYPDVFDELYVNIVQVGENMGRLDLVFQQLGRYLELEKETRRRIVTAVRYPIFVLVAISIAITVLNIWVIPVFAELFSGMGADLPFLTRLLINFSNLFVNYWLLLLAALLISVFGVRYYINTPKGRLQWDRYKLKIPLIGSILSRSLLARFCRSFSMMLKSGVPLINALELTSQAIGNAYLKERIRSMREGIQRGESLLRVAGRSDMFTPLVMQMIQVGEETGQIDEMLAEVGLFYEEEVDYDLKSLSSYIEPILLSFIAAIVTVLALGIFLPMWDMMNVMQP